MTVALSDQANQADPQWQGNLFYWFSGKSRPESSLKRVQRRHAAGRWAASLALLIFGFAFAVPASAAEAEFDFNVPRQPVHSALMEFAEQADLTLVFPDDVVRDKSANTLTGRHTLQQGADILLAGTGLTPTFSDATVLSISAHGQSMSQSMNQSMSQSINKGSVMKKDKGNNTVANRNRLFAALAGLASGLFGAEALAQSQSEVSDRPAIEEIIVTASKREESLQDVSVSVTAFSGDSIESLGFENGLDVSAQVPNFTFTSLLGPSGPPFLTIRGITSIDFSFINEPSVGTYVDEVYQGANASVTGQIFDLERIEVLRGPQGTLFGRNTTGGLVHFVSRKPSDEFNGYASVQIGQNSQVIVEGAAGGPISDDVRGRIAFKSNTDDGYQKNLNPDFNDSRWGKTDVQSLRATLQIDLNDDWMAEANLKHAESNGTASMYRFSGLFSTDEIPTSAFQAEVAAAQDAAEAALPPGATADEIDDARDAAEGSAYASRACGVEAFLNDRCFNGAGASVFDAKADEGLSVFHSIPQEYNAFGGYLKFTGDLGWADFVSISAFEEYDDLVGQDFEAHTEAVGYLNTVKFFESEQFSQEFRLSGGDEGLRWVAGAYYYTDEKDANLLIYLGPDQINFIAYDAATETESLAAFGELNFALADNLRGIVGARITQEERVMTRYDRGSNFSGDPKGGSYSSRSFFDQIGDIDETEFTWRGSLEWTPTDDALYYAQVSTGYKSGAWSVSASGSTTVAATGPADSERVTSYELGGKTEWFDNRLRANLAVFYQDFEDLQAQVTIPDPGSVVGSTNVYFNAGSADIYGLELELTYVPHDSWEFVFGLGTLDSELKSIAEELDGGELATPAWMANYAIRYFHDLGDRGHLTAQLDGFYQDDTFLGADNNPYEVQEAHSVANLRLTWDSPSERYSVQGFVENAGDEEYVNYALQSTPAGASGFGFRTSGLPRAWGVRVSTRL